MSSTVDPPEFLTSVLQQSRPHQGGSGEDRIPRVTLTFAQSLDAKIAGKDGKQLTLSGKESMIMTHWMRTMHDAILVGIGTVINDNPQLNVRHLPSAVQDRLPRPVILDSYLRMPIDSKLLQNYKEGRGRQPWIVCASSPDSKPGCNGGEKSALKHALEEAGADILEVPSENGLLSINAVLETLHGLGIRSVMVEGGAKVIGSFFAEELQGRSVVNTVIVTVAPTFVGQHGIGYGVEGLQIPPLKHVRTEVMGRDTVIAMQEVL